MARWGRSTPKANCYRVLLRADAVLGAGLPKLWWPIVAADNPKDAARRAAVLYGSNDAMGGINRGLPARQTVEIIEVALMHPTSLHDDPHHPDVNKQRSTA